MIKSLTNLTTSNLHPTASNLHPRLPLQPNSFLSPSSLLPPSSLPPYLTFIPFNSQLLNPNAIYSSNLLGSSLSGHADDKESDEFDGHVQCFISISLSYVMFFYPLMMLVVQKFTFPCFASYHACFLDSDSNQLLF